MTAQTYASFAVFALVVTLVPGPDFAVVLRNAIVRGRAAGLWAMVGISLSNVLQATAVVLGLGALVVASQPLFTAVRWLGAGYLLYLAVQAFRAAWRGRYAPDQLSLDGRTSRAAWVGARQGFLSNVTNPKVLAFYLAVLPQFLPAGTPVTQALSLALIHAAISAVFLTAVVLAAARARRTLTRRRVRRTIDALTGTAMLGFGARLVLEQA